MISIEREICSEFDTAASREWLETNGIGGFASGTVSGANTRRYHSILTAATDPPLGRITTVSKIEETIVVDGERFELSSNQFPGNIHPRGFEYLISFRIDPFPVWTFAVGGIEIEKRLLMAHGRNATVVQYKAKSRIRGKRPSISMTLRPLIAMTDYHQLQHQTDSFNEDYISRNGEIEMRPAAGMPPVFFAHNGTGVEKTGYWYHNFEYSIEKERGFDFREDLFQPFELSFDLKTPAAIIISTGRAIDASAAADIERSEVKRRKALLKSAGVKTDFAKELVLAADQFIVERGEGHTVIAGYPWFSDWGRDTMIALPGLTLSTGRPEIARGILLEFAKNVSEGMLPNRFSDVGDDAEYNTVDATLWYFEAVRAYMEKTGDKEFVRENIYPVLADILVHHLRGTRFNIHVDTDGLLYAGEPGVQLTWMDAKVGDDVITPRTGKAVEIQALWYNALRTMEDLAFHFGDDTDKAKYDSMADLAKLSFNAVFWNEDEQCLFDVVENGSRDGSVRPNQIFAASLPFSMLDDERARKVVEKVEAELLTPVGLRSLSPADPKYIPVYIGSPFERDSAYHQGTVWAWLIGPFVDAYRRLYSKSEDRIAEILSGFEGHLYEAGLGQISEIFDAERPHTPRGCPAQAWSVAEVLRVLKEIK